MPKIRKGEVLNPDGCPKGAHHIGRPASKVKKLAKRRSLKIMSRLTKIAEGKDLEQVINEAGESIKIAAAIREQIKASEIVLKVADELSPDVQINDNSRLFFVFEDGDPKSE